MRRGWIDSFKSPAAKFLVLLLAVVFPFASCAANEIAEPVSAIQPCETLEVSTGPDALIRFANESDSSLATIRTHPESFQLRSLSRGFGFQRGALWIWMTIENRSAVDCARWLVIDPALQKTIRLHVVAADGSVKITEGGATIPEELRSIKTDRYAIFPLVLPANSRYDAYLEFRGDALMLFTAKFWEIGRFLERQQSFVTSKYLLIGASVVVFFASLLAAFIQQRRGLAFGALAWMFALLYILIRDDNFPEGLASVLNDPRQQGMQVCAVLFVASHCGFTSAYLPEESWFRSLRRLLQVIAALYGLAAFFFLFVSIPKLVVFSTGIALTLLVCSSLIAAIRNGGVAWTYLAGWIALVLAVLSRIAHAFGLFEFDTDQIDLIGPTALGVSSITTSLALFQSVRAAQRDARSAEMALSTQRESENARMRIAVQEATHGIQQALAQVRQASQDKSKFLSMVAHEINSPLHVILGNVNLARRAAGAKIEAHLHDIERAGNSMLKLANQTLRFSRGESMPVTVDISPVNLQTFVDELCSSFNSRYGDAAERLHVEIAGPVPDCVETDAQHLHQVLENIVDNAFKYAPHGDVGVTIEALPGKHRHTEPGPKMDDGTSAELIELRFSVQDAGPGIATHLHHKVFEPFSRLSTDSQQHGVGLGMAICQQLLHAMGSQLNLFSATGEGCRFWFDLAVKPTQNARLLSRTVAMSQESPSTPHQLQESELAKARALLELGQLVALEHWARSLQRTNRVSENFLESVLESCAAVDLARLKQLLSKDGNSGRNH